MGGVHLNDPHVEELRYRIETGGELVFDNPPPIDDQTDGFRMTLADGVVSFKMKEHYPTEESFLSGWSLSRTCLRKVSWFRPSAKYDTLRCRSSFPIIYELLLRLKCRSLEFLLPSS